VVTWLVLWLPSFNNADSIAMPSSLNPAYYFVFNLFGNHSLIHEIFAFVFIIGGAFVLNFTLSEFGLISKNTFLPAFFYVLLMSCHTAFLKFHPYLISNIFLMLLLRKIFYANGKDDSLKDVFATGLFTALAALFAFKLAVLILFVFFFLVVLRIISLRYWLAMVTGFVTVLLYVASYYFFTDQLVLKWHNFVEFISNSLFKHHWQHFKFTDYFLFVSLLFMLVVALFSELTSITEKIISIRRLEILLFWFFIGCVVSFFIYTDQFFIDLTLLFLPATIFLSLYMSSLKKTFFAEMLLLIVIAGIVLQRLM
jgi:hypothetical protein